MLLYKLCSLLLCYPEQELLDSLPEIKQHLNHHKTTQANFEPLLTFLQSHDLIFLQENYVQSFDQTPSQSLHLFEHIHGEDRVRGQAMVDLMQEYQQAEFDITANELPDYLPLFLEFLSVISVENAQELLGNAIHVINHIRQKLTANQSPYAVIFDTLVELSPVIPQALVQAPVKTMDEAMEKFGANYEGLEPLLVNNNLTSQVACATCSSTKRS